jgi:hypothetical protein
VVGGDVVETFVSNTDWRDPPCRRGFKWTASRRARAVEIGGQERVVGGELADRRRGG